MIKSLKIAGIMVSFLFASAGLSGPASAGDSEAYFSSATGAATGELALHVAETKIIRLHADVPPGQRLKAYSLALMFNNEFIALKKVQGAPGSLSPPKNVNDQVAGKVTVNGFDVQGVPGPASVALLDLSIEGIREGQTTLQAMFKSFGQSKDDQFIPEPILLNVAVGR